MKEHFSPHSTESQIRSACPAKRSSQLMAGISEVQFKSSRSALDLLHQTAPSGYTSSTVFLSLHIKSEFSSSFYKLLSETKICKRPWSTSEHPHLNLQHYLQQKSTSSVLSKALEKNHSSSFKRLATNSCRKQHWAIWEILNMQLITKSHFPRWKDYGLAGSTLQFRLSPQPESWTVFT